MMYVFVISECHVLSRKAASDKEAAILREWGIL